MFKLAMILSMAEQDERWVGPQHVERVLKLLDENEENLLHIMSTVTANETGDKSDKILAHIKKAGKIKHTDLLRHCWRFGNADEISSHLATLIEAGEVIQSMSSDNRTRFYEPAKKW